MTANVHRPEMPYAEPSQRHGQRSPRELEAGATEPDTGPRDKDTRGSWPTGGSGSGWIASKSPGDPGLFGLMWGLRFGLNTADHVSLQLVATVVGSGIKARTRALSSVPGIRHEHGLHVGVEVRQLLPLKHGVCTRNTLMPIQLRAPRTLPARRGCCRSPDLRARRWPGRWLRDLLQVHEGLEAHSSGASPGARPF